MHFIHPSIHFPTVYPVQDHGGSGAYCSSTEHKYGGILDGSGSSQQGTHMNGILIYLGHIFGLWQESQNTSGSIH